MNLGNLQMQERNMFCAVSDQIIFFENRCKRFKDPIKKKVTCLFYNNKHMYCLLINPLFCIISFKT